MTQMTKATESASCGHYLDYYWKSGKPYGKGKTNPFESPVSYKIIADPYYKRISVEKYSFLTFDTVIYDSLLLDFRHLTLKDQIAWERITLKEENNKTTSLLRDQYDRSLFIEIVTFEGNQSKTCHVRSIHGISLCTHRMFYQEWQDPFNGVILYDNENRRVMQKIYEINLVTKEFTNIIKEEWNMEKVYAYHNFS